jgi:DNA-binding winged helix-turn-helix (wHTH) protein
LDPENHLLQSEGTPISLTPKAFEILLVLIENGNGLTTKEELMRKVWPDNFVEEANLTINISALRKQRGETPNGQQSIETVPRKPIALRCLSRIHKLITRRRRMDGRSSLRTNPLESLWFEAKIAESAPRWHLETFRGRESGFVCL